MRFAPLLFSVSFAVIVYTYLGYPLAIGLLARLFPRPWLRSPWPGGPPPISVVMAVHNGASMLPAKLAHLLALDPHLIREIIVVSDGSSDATAALLAQTQDRRLKTILLPQQAGKAAAVNHGVAMATGEIVLFVDIRPHIELGALEALLANFADPRVGCVAGELLLQTEGLDAPTAAVSGLYWRYEQWIRNCEAAVDSPTGVYGGFYAIRRSLASPAPDGLILDDVFQPLAVIRQGYRSVLDRTAFVTDRWPSSSSGEFQRKVRTLAGNFQLVALCFWVVTPANRVLFQFISHKLLRLIVPYCFILLLIASAMQAGNSRMFLIATLLQIFFWLLAAGAIKYRLPLLNRIAAPAAALLVLNTAAIVGFKTFLLTRGPLWKIWTPTIVDTSSHLPENN